MIRGRRLLETCFGTSWQRHQWPTWMDKPPTGRRESTTPSSLDQAFRMPSHTNNSSEASCPSTPRISQVGLMKHGDSLRSNNNKTLLSRTSKEPRTSLKMTNNKFSLMQRMFCSRTLVRIGWFSSKINQIISLCKRNTSIISNSYCKLSLLLCQFLPISQLASEWWWIKMLLSTRPTSCLTQCSFTSSTLTPKIWQQRWKTKKHWPCWTKQS